MTEMEVLVVGIGLVASLLYSELFGVTPGGIIVPGYLALSIRDPVVLSITLAVALLTFLAVRVVAAIAIVYGRRRTALSVLIGFALGSLARNALGVGTPVGPFEVDVIGYVVPGLLAIWMDRQGAVVTGSSAITVSVATHLAGILMLGA